MKKIILLLCFIVISSSAYSQLYFNENFSYPAGDSLGAHGWLNASPNGVFGTNTRLVVANTGLVYAGYPLSNIGNSASVTNSGQDSYSNFLTPIDSANGKSVYTSFMIRVDSANRPGDYFLALLPPTSVTNYTGRIFIRSLDVDNNLDSLNFGLSKGSPSDTTNPGFWSTALFSAHTTYLVVMKYTFVTGSSNDILSLFVFASGIPSTEPVTPTIGPLTFPSNTDAFSLGRVALRQGTAIRAPSSQVDGIRVTTSWFPSVWNVKLAVQGLFNSSTGMLNKRDTVDIIVRKIIPPYDVIDSAVAVIDSVTLTGQYVFNNTPNGTYYFVAKYRNLPQYRNGISTWSKAGGQVVNRSDANYDFTTAASQAFGNNMILQGTTWTTWNGDPSQDGFVDLTDVIAVYNDSKAFVVGYINTDMNGDSQVDLTDVLLVYNNATKFVHEEAPL